MAYTRKLICSTQVILRDLARVHSQYLCKMEWLSSQPWLEVREGRRMVAMATLWRALLDHAKSEFPEIWTEERFGVCVCVCVCVCACACMCVCVACLHVIVRAR